MRQHPASKASQLIYDSGPGASRQEHPCIPQRRTSEQEGVISLTRWPGSWLHVEVQLVFACRDRCLERGGALASVFLRDVRGVFFDPRGRGRRIRLLDIGLGSNEN